MSLTKQYQKTRKALKTRGIIWATKNLPLNYKHFGDTGVLHSNDQTDCIESKILHESTAAPVPRDLYDKTADFMRTDLYDDNNKTVTVTNKACIWQVPEGRVYTNQASQYFVLDRNGKIIPSVSYKYADAIAGRGEEEIELAARYFPKPERIPGKVVNFILGGGPSSNIYHWMMDALPGLKLLEEIYPLDEIDMFVVQGKGYPDWIETLTLLGIDRSKIRVFDQQLIHIQADELITMTHPRGRLSNITPKWVIDYHREKYLPTIPEKADHWPEKVYVSRKDSSLRGILNDEELSEYLEKQGYTEIVLTQLTYAEKVGYFHHAKEIVAMSGAGFAFLAYCQPKTKVVELFPSGFVHYANCVIATQVDLDHRYLIFGNTDTEKSGYSAQRQELVVNIDQLNEELNA